MKYRTILLSGALLLAGCSQPSQSAEPTEADCYGTCQVLHVKVDGGTVECVTFEGLRRAGGGISCNWDALNKADTNPQETDN